MRDATRHLFDHWWERTAHLARFAPVIVMLATAMILRTHGYNWE